MNYKLEEIYYSSRFGLIQITNLYKESKENQEIGEFISGRRKDRVFKLYDYTKIQLATDQNIIEYITQDLTYHKLSQDSSCTIGEDYLFISAGCESIELSKFEARALRDLLNQELN